WRVSTIGEAASVVGGSTPSTKVREFWDGPHAFATPKDLSLTSAPVLLDTARRVTEAGLAKIGSGLLPKGMTVLMSSRAPIGYLAVAQLPVAVNQGIAAIVCDRYLKPSFVLNWARQSMGEIESRAGGTTFAEISKSKFREVPCLIPTREVHDAFDDAAGPCYRLIAANTAEARTLAEFRDALLPKLVSGEMLPLGADSNGGP
ncbi:MAG: restriction endonuclease subunit S, partial [Chloroflexi bacterium]|nr:restriction endonuclease subunit S [Chloroflexota bacterium]